MWEKYKLNNLPDEQRAEVVKIVAHELEETARVRLNSSKYQFVRGMAVVGLLLATIPLCIVGSSWVNGWTEVRVKSLTPMVCPAPPPVPPCPAPTAPTFDIKVVPITAPVASAK